MILVEAISMKCTLEITVGASSRQAGNGFWPKIIAGLWLHANPAEPAISAVPFPAPVSVLPIKRVSFRKFKLTLLILI